MGTEVLRPLMLDMITLEGQKYVTDSLVIPTVESIHTMIGDFESRWGDGTDIDKYTLGTNNTNKGQTCGYTKRGRYYASNLTLAW